MKTNHEAQRKAFERRSTWYLPYTSADGVNAGANARREFEDVGVGPSGSVATAKERPAKRVVVIEDNVDAANSLQDVLELCGHEVAVAYDGASGVALARDKKPDIVLCDIGLPGMDGYAVARVLRADPCLAGTRLEALSGYARREDLERAIEAGFDGHLKKPPSIDQLEQLLARLNPERV